jgi:hypothetical protein
MPIFGHVGGLPVEELLILAGPAATTALLLGSVWLMKARRALTRRARGRDPLGPA